ncbi:hypothetical protein OG588_16020 [Streptomyces prunicolor]|uniref:DUF6879 family protein n=1 Tax=Streptomyces prunicolor TaxID=67348 RepID=UPI00386603E5|nr:hypothetical protein OG588_16020 [Streptomyces prunicolor]
MKKTLVTLVVAVPVYVLTNVLDQNQDQVWKLTVSLVIGGAALIIQYMNDFERRLEGIETGQRNRIREMRESLTDHNSEMSENLAAHNRAMENVVNTNFARINEATKLFSEMGRSVLRPDGVAELADSATRVSLLGTEIVHTFAREEIDQLTSLMKGLTNRSAESPGENHDWLMALTKCTKDTIDATSTSVDRNFWTSEPGRRYLLAQRDAIKLQRVKVRRLFIVDEPADVEAELTGLCENQQALGIEARVVVLSQVPEHARLGPTSDFIIFDGALCYEVDQDLKQVNVKTTLDAREEHVKRCVKWFDELWEVSQ